MPSAANASRSCSLANGSNCATSRDAMSMTVTSRAPRRFHACAISTPTTPPPSTSSRAGTSCALVTARLSHGCTSPRPSIGGITADEPVASTTAFVASSSRTVPSDCVDVDAALADQTPVAAHQHTARTVEPLHLAVVVPVGGDVVSPRQRAPQRRARR